MSREHSPGLQLAESLIACSETNLRRSYLPSLTTKDLG
jgi:hypothetical protein